ncbi:MAG: hypothetical protein KME31_27505 [Tolypothrix carrinoi HA7290-LM1]|nr:hypothetical protein [Tolypothrix carrinoi HA7290-LM1]
MASSQLPLLYARGCALSVASSRRQVQIAFVTSCRRTADGGHAAQVGHCPDCAGVRTNALAHQLPITAFPIANNK